MENTAHSVTVAFGQTILVNSLVGILVVLMHWLKKQLGKKWFISVYRFQVVISESQGRSSRIEPGGRKHRETLLSVLSYIIQTHLHRGGTSHRGLDPPTSVIKQDNAPQTSHTPIWWWHLLSWEPLFPGDSSQYHLAKKKKINHQSGQRSNTGHTEGQIAASII